MFKHIDNIEDKVILDKHLTRYLDAVSKTLVITEAFILVSTFIIATLVIKGFYPYKINVKIDVSVSFYFFDQFIHKIIAWIIIGIYFLIYKKLPSRKRKNVFCTILIILTALIVYGSWNVNYFGFLFIVPIMVSSPFSKKTNKVVFIVCTLLDAGYTVFQSILRQDRYNYIIGLITITIIIACYFFARSLHKTMYNTLLDVKQYTTLSKSLSEEVAHDYLTNAFSISALHKDLDNNNKYRSLAFIDLDDFKSINDKYGHTVGDNILKLLVTIANEKALRIYRYGGDEFIVISEHTAEILTKELEALKTDFTNGSYDYYSFKATVSIGVINIVGKEKLFEYLKQCDRLMYISKKTGKNKITTENTDNTTYPIF